MSDGGGLYLLVHPNGSKYWRFDFRFGGKQKSSSLGVWPGVTLAEARKIRNSYKKKINEGVNPIEERKLLLNKKEINKLIGKMQREGFTIIPTKMYFKKGKAKIEIAVAKGKKKYDKRHAKKTRDWNREKSRYFRKSS